jgi:hypothetical protein
MLLKSTTTKVGKDQWQRQNESNDSNSSECANGSSSVWSPGVRSQGHGLLLQHHVSCLSVCVYANDCVSLLILCSLTHLPQKGPGMRDSCKYPQKQVYFFSLFLHENGRKDDHPGSCPLILWSLLSLFPASCPLFYYGHTSTHHGICMLCRQRVDGRVVVKESASFSLSFKSGRLRGDSDSENDNTVMGVNDRSCCRRSGGGWSASLSSPLL